MSGMTSNRPYLIRALYDWISDNGFTPYILVDATAPDVRVPGSAIREGKVVLNIALRAVDQLDLGNDTVSFRARFSGVSLPVSVPVVAIEAIYAQENGQGMLLPPDQEPDSPDPDPPTRDGRSDKHQGERKPRRPIKGPPRLRVVK
jgi:stringent starvation protein B